MKLLTYQCGDCEDTEQWAEILCNGFHCECGGHLYLVKQDNFKKKIVSECDICLNKGTDHCVDCTRNKEPK